MDKDVPSHEGQSEDQSIFLATCELIEAGLYDQVADLLHATQNARDHASKKNQSEFIDAAYQICLACEQFKTEKIQRQKAFEEANQREKALQEQLQAMVRLCFQNGYNPPGEADLASPTKTKASGDDHRQPKPSNLWQRLQDRLGFQIIRSANGSEPSIEQDGEIPQKSADEQRSILEPAVAQLPDPPRQHENEQEDGSHPVFVIYCLGQFQVYQSEQLVQEWPSGKGKSIFKYLIAQRKQPVPKEVLMELFWPGANPDAARNNLNVSIYGLRQALRNTNPDYSHILFQEESYLMNPEMKIWVDVEEFNKRIQAGRQKEKHGQTEPALHDYRAAEALYQGEFLAEDRYEDWMIPQRQRLQADYLELLDSLSRHYLAQQDIGACVAVCHKILTVDPCREEAHRQLMRCYTCQGQPYLALRQYHMCETALKGELDLPPSEETQDLYTKIREGRVNQTS